MVYFFQSGEIRTSSGSYFIRPVENYTNENTNILHAMYRAPTPIKTHNDTTDHAHCDVQDQIGEFYIL